MVVFYIIRHTYGFTDRKELQVTFTKMALEIEVERANVSRAITDLLMACVIYRIKNDTKKYTSYGINKYYRNWKRLLPEEKAYQKRHRKKCCTYYRK